MVDSAHKYFSKTPASDREKEQWEEIQKKKRQRKQVLLRQATHTKDGVTHNVFSVAVPKWVVDERGLKKGDKLEVSVVKGMLVFEKT